MLNGALKQRLYFPGDRSELRHHVSAWARVSLVSDVQMRTKSLNSGGLNRFPASFAQGRIWFLEQLEGQLVAYNMPVAWRLRGPLNAEALRRALEAIVRRHEPLRTTFELEDSLPV